MCIPTKLQQNIIDRTNEGDTIAAFLVDTMQGQHTDAKFNHRLEAAKHLIKYGFPDEARHQGQFDLNKSKVENADKKTPSPSTGEGWDGGDNPPQPVTHLDILNYEIAHLIRHETAEGHTVVNFLVDIMTGRDRPFTPKKFCIKPADRMAAENSCAVASETLAHAASQTPPTKQTPTTPCTPTSPSECESTANAAPTPSASSLK